VVLERIVPCSIYNIENYFLDFFPERKVSGLHTRAFKIQNLISFVAQYKYPIKNFQFEEDSCEGSKFMLGVFQHK
jgi:hypothetical protein